MVTCIDKHTAEIAALTSRQVPIFESGLEELLAASVAGRLFGIPARGCCDRRFQAPRSDRDQHDGHARPRGHGRNRPLYLNQPPMFLVDRRTFELIKYAANPFPTANIAFINEIAELYENVEANVQDGPL